MKRGLTCEQVVRGYFQNMEAISLPATRKYKCDQHHPIPKQQESLSFSGPHLCPFPMESGIHRTKQMWSIERTHPGPLLLDQTLDTWESGIPMLTVLRPVPESM